MPRYGAQGDRADAMTIAEQRTTKLETLTGVWVPKRNIHLHKE